MGPASGQMPSGALLDRIDEDFGSFDTFKANFSAAALKVFGSGWVWLVPQHDGSLAIKATANQDTPVDDGFQPVLGLDVWEHAYYLKYFNVRANYIDAWWNVVNWKVVEANFHALKNW
jgi:superoxide dismutase, Fe-Mn family